jgi:hypothetical protein
MEISPRLMSAGEEIIPFLRLPEKNGYKRTCENKQWVIERLFFI